MHPDAHVLPVFSQWDLGVAYRRHVGRAALQGRLALINAFDRRNVVDWIIEDRTEGLRRVARPNVGFFPTVSIQARF